MTLRNGAHRVHPKLRDRRRVELVDLFADGQWTLLHDRMENVGAGRNFRHVLRALDAGNQLHNHGQRNISLKRSNFRISRN